jgi:hypothetical protein
MLPASRLLVVLRDRQERAADERRDEQRDAAPPIARAQVTDAWDEVVPQPRGERAPTRRQPPLALVIPSTTTGCATRSTGRAPRSAPYALAPRATSSGIPIPAGSSASSGVAGCSACAIDGTTTANVAR